MTSIALEPTLEKRDASRQLGAVVLALQLWLVAHHSPWRDEVQALLIARKPLGQLFAALHYEGHPALWYLLLKLVDYVAPLWTLAITQAAIAIGLQTLIWAKSPFRWPVKLAVALSYFVAFEYGVIARSYGLGALLLFAFVIWRDRRWSWALLALLANVHALFAAIAGLAVIWQWAEGRRSVPGAALVGSGLALAVASAWPAADVVKTVALAPSPIGRVLIFLLWSGKAILPGLPLNALPTVPWWLLLGLAPPVLGVFALWGRKLHVGLFLGLYLVALALAAVVYPQLTWHLGVLVLWFLALLWAQADEGLLPNASAKLWLVGLLAGGVWVMALSLAGDPYSNARAIAAWAKEKRIAGPWAAYPGHEGLEISGQTGQPTFNLEKGCWNTAPRWDYHIGQVRPEAIGPRLRAFALATGGGYVVSPYDTLPGATMLAAFKGHLYPFSTYVYRVNALPTPHRQLPGCAALP